MGGSGTAVSSSPLSSPGSSSPVVSSSRHGVLTSNTDTFDEGEDKRYGMNDSNDISYSDILRIMPVPSLIG